MTLVLLASLAVIVLITVVIVNPFGSSHGDADPGGRILATLRPSLDIIPPGGQVMLSTSNEPQWGYGCEDNGGLPGWGPVMVDAEFRTNEPVNHLFTDANARVTQLGWSLEQTDATPLGPEITWTRPLPTGGHATVTLSPGDRGPGTPTFWDLDAIAPPHGKQPTCGPHLY
jgi:hypothetical protein